MLDGFQVTRQGSEVGQARVNVVAHSSGTTTASIALTRTQHTVQSVTFVGSAGVDTSWVPDAAAMNIDRDQEGHVNLKSTRAANDWMLPLGREGSFDQSMPSYPRVDPETRFGARTLSAEGGYDPDAAEAYYAVTGYDAKGWASQYRFDASTTGHGYLDPGTGLVRNIALASTGKADKIPVSVPLKKRWESINPQGENSWCNFYLGRFFSDEADQNPKGFSGQRHGGLRRPR